jgi:DNA repair protein RecO (recombination protein O)
MTTLRSEALVLRSVDFGESDRILHLLVPERGRVTAIAKGARRSVKRFGGTLDFFNHLKVELEHRRPNSMSRLDQAQLIHTYVPLRMDPRRFALGCYLLELLDRLAPEGGAPEDMRRLFAFALAALTRLSERSPDATLRTILELRALDALGLRPELSRCVRCAREVPNNAPRDATAGFSVADGGPLCGACAVGVQGLLRVQLGTLRSLDGALRMPLDRLDRLVLPAAALSEARQLLGRFQHFHVGVALQSERLLDQLLPDPH